MFFSLPAHADRLSNFEIRVGMNPTDFSQNSLCYNMTTIAPAGMFSNYPCMSVATGRYLSIQRYPPYLSVSRAVTVCEVQAFSQPLDQGKWSYQCTEKITF